MAFSLRNNIKKNGINMELRKANILKALCMMQDNA